MTKKNGDYTGAEITRRFELLGGEEMAKRALQLADRIKPLLAGRGPDLQSAALLELVSIWLAGNHPKLREALWKEWTAAVLDMVTIQEKEMFSKRPRPEGWQ